MVEVVADMVAAEMVAAAAEMVAAAAEMVVAAAEIVVAAAGVLLVCYHSESQYYAHQNDPCSC